MAFKKGHTSWNKGMKGVYKLKHSGQFKKGYKHTEEWKKRLGEMSMGNTYALGNKLTKEHRRKTSERMKIDNPMFRLGARKKISEIKKGKPCSEEAKVKIRKANLGKKYSVEINKKKGRSGEENASWKGGISFEPYGLEFNKKLKKQIRRRDNFQCRECNFTEKQLGYRLTCHHIDYDKRNNNPNNLISLCKSCHGQTNFKRKDWANYFKEKVYA